MSSRENPRQKESKSARPPEYTIIRRQTGTPGGRQPPQLKRTGRSKKEAKFEEAEARHEQRREERYRSRRRKQWMLAIGIIVVFIWLLVIALIFLESRSTNTPNTPAAGSAAYHTSARFS